MLGLGGEGAIVRRTCDNMFKTKAVLTYRGISISKCFSLVSWGPEKPNAVLCIPENYGDCSAAAQRATNTSCSLANFSVSLSRSLPP